VLQHYIGCLQQLLPRVVNGSPVINSGSSNASAAAAQQAIEALVLQRREMTDRHALFSHYYWAVWCFNKGELAAQGLAPPTLQQWTQVMHSLNLRWAAVAGTACHLLQPRTFRTVAVPHMVHSRQECAVPNSFCSGKKRELHDSCLHAPLFQSSAWLGEVVCWCCRSH
jgi:hypothetical protein